MKILKNKKLVSLLAVALFTLSFAINVFAGSTVFTNKCIYGGPSQDIATQSKEMSRPVLYVQSVTWNGQSGWQYRGYNHATGTICTTLVNVSGVGHYVGTYTASATTVRVRSSIASTSVSDYLYFSGNLTT